MILKPWFKPVQCLKHCLVSEMIDITENTTPFLIEKINSDNHLIIILLSIISIIA